CKHCDQPGVLPRRIAAECWRRYESRRDDAERKRWGGGTSRLRGRAALMTEERQMLRETVAALVAKHADPAAVRAGMDSARGYDESLWQLLCEQVGAAALMIPEELGGAGGELADAATVLQELGRNLVPSPLLGTTLAELALLTAPEPDAETLEGLAEGSSIGALVLDAAHGVNGDI